ncbi:Sugar or nucleoside kinase, ribokinase family [Limimonas halophila]|uniref:Sugar or nucleoside kinase, ribokinase family n=1 Tax=Limimonas halophila TaxID=1082479 RepID=A0A1G7UBY1_9PROT|nr:PfkB family carbohydrate kinase [Limimonas halophila]SDG44878.1 Sugar or nucleoside kinase, ribokinase family [Limimonas halophila]
MTATGKPIEVLAAGPVTRDRIVALDGSVREQPGGSAFYAAAVHARLGLTTALLTQVAARDRRELLAPLDGLGIRFLVRPAHATTRFTNTLTEAGREQAVPRLAPPLKPEAFEQLAAAAIQLGPLTRDDIPPATVTAARERCTWLALDVQGLTRRVAAGRVRACRGVSAEALARADILKADAAEARLVTGWRDPRHAVRALASMGRGEAVVTLGANGALVAAGGQVQPVPPVDAGAVADTTGCGDSFLAGYLARRLRGDAPWPAARFAGAVAALKATHHGPFSADAAEVRAFFNQSTAG